MILSNIWNTIKTDVGNFFAKEKPVLDDAFAKANNIVNILKAIIGSGTGQTVITILEMVLPAPAVVIVKGVIVTFLTDFGLATAEESKPVEEIILDGFSAIAKLTGSSKVVALSGVVAIVAHAIDGANGGTTTIQQAIVAAPIVYDPSILSPALAVAPAAPQTGSTEQP